MLDGVANRTLFHPISGFRNNDFLIVREKLNAECDNWCRLPIIFSSTEMEMKSWSRKSTKKPGLGLFGSYDSKFSGALH